MLIARIFVVSSAVLFALILTRPADACDCAIPNGLALLLPRDGMTDLPSDFVIWVSSRGFDPTVTVDGVTWELGDEIALVGMKLLMFTRPAVAPVGATHDVRVCTPDSFCADAAFTTVAERAAGELTAPRVRKVRVDEEGGGLFGTSSCGESTIAHVDTTSAPQQLVLLDVSAKSDTDPFVKGTATMVSATDASGATSFLLGDPPCDVETWDFEENDEARFRVGSFDAAGRFSGWSKRHLAETGCSGAGAGGLASLLAAIVLVSLRRRA